MYFLGKTTPEQAHDLLNFRQIGSDHLDNYIGLRILRQPSANAPTRKHRLLTMTEPKLESKRVSQRVRELKQVTKRLRQRLAWCNRTGQRYDPSFEQYSTYPRAIYTTRQAFRTRVLRQYGQTKWKKGMQQSYVNVHQ